MVVIVTVEEALLLVAMHEVICRVEVEKEMLMIEQSDRSKGTAEKG